MFDTEVEMRDIDGHKFLIPHEQVSEFNKLITKIRDTEFYTDEFYDACDKFWDRFSMYAR